MEVTMGQQIRDATGTFACPVVDCWRAHRRGLVPGTPTCPDCGVALDWGPDVLAYHARYGVREKPTFGREEP